MVWQGRRGAYSTRSVTLCLATFAQLALVEGDPELAAQVRQALGEDRFDQVFAAGSRLSQREAVAAAGNQRGASTSLTV